MPEKLVKAIDWFGSSVAALFIAISAGGISLVLIYPYKPSDLIGWLLFSLFTVIYAAANMYISEIKKTKSSFASSLATIGVFAIVMLIGFKVLPGHFDKW